MVAPSLFFNFHASCCRADTLPVPACHFRECRFAPARSFLQESDRNSASFSVSGSQTVELPCPNLFKSPAWRARRVWPPSAPRVVSVCPACVRPGLGTARVPVLVEFAIRREQVEARGHRALQGALWRVPCGASGHSAGGFLFFFDLLCLITLTAPHVVGNITCKSARLHVFQTAMTLILLPTLI